jgi:hypothetical protein
MQIHVLLWSAREHTLLNVGHHSPQNALCGCCTQTDYPPKSWLLEMAPNLKSCTPFGSYIYSLCYVITVSLILMMACLLNYGVKIC